MNRKQIRKKQRIKETDKCYLCNNKAQVRCIECGGKICNKCRDGKTCYKCSASNNVIELKEKVHI